VRLSRQEDPKRSRVHRDPSAEAPTNVQAPSRRPVGVSDRLLTARELAEYLGLKPATVLDKWERGELPGYKFGRAVRFDLEEILALGRQGTGSPSNSVSTLDVMPRIP